MCVCLRCLFYYLDCVSKTLAIRKHKQLFMSALTSHIPCTHIYCCKRGTQWSMYTHLLLQARDTVVHVHTPTAASEGHSSPCTPTAASEGHSGPCTPTYCCKRGTQWSIRTRYMPTGYFYRMSNCTQQISKPYTSTTSYIHTYKMSLDIMLAGITVNHAIPLVVCVFV